MSAPRLSETEHIVIQGARQHNLKNIHLKLPRNRLIVITGLSGSGKSSLAFDTLYAEGQRRYVESLSAYARQFLERLEKPDVDLIEGLSPAIAIEQKAGSHNPRSTVGTVTEIHDYLRLLFARIGIPHCPDCGLPIRSQTLDQMIDQVMALPERTRIMILSPLVTDLPGTHGALLKNLKRQGFTRAKIDGVVQEMGSAPGLRKDAPHTIEAVIDRLVIKGGIRNRLADSLELALAQTEGRAVVETMAGERICLNERATCPGCGEGFPDVTPTLFSFNAPSGACPGCDGLGSVSTVDPELVVPNPALTLREGAILPWAQRHGAAFIEFLEALCRTHNADIYTPFQDLPPAFREMLMHGAGETEIRFAVDHGGRRQVYSKRFEGVIPELSRRYHETDSPRSREEIRGYMSVQPCPRCRGRRLNPAACAVRVAGRTLPELCALPIPDARAFLEGMVDALPGKDAAVAGKLVGEIRDRLAFIAGVGLGYLTLGRAAGTLSGGESQRIRLATQIGSKLTGVLYVLDEPSIGLHQRDNRMLLEMLFQMRDLGNTVLVVEHDEETIRHADHVVDMGPGAGVHGGEVVFSGSCAALLHHPDSLTGAYLSGRRAVVIPRTRRRGDGRTLRVRGASENNLKQVDVAFPLGCMICVTGVSGSGKSTLVLEVLYKALVQRLNRRHIRAGAHREVAGVDHLDKVIHVDQSPIGRTPRSNPGTYIGVFNPIREVFARVPESRMRGFKAGRFSFNVKGGRCEACQGDGIIRIEMHFLPDLYVRCDACQGRRYNRETLDIRYKGKNIAQVLEMTASQALSFFENLAPVREKLQTLVDVGLGYIKLGQSATTLSGGEAQRVKLARELSRRATGRTLYILDEPTTGLHTADIEKLLQILGRLTDLGNTVIIIEHHMDVIKSADHIIDLGPEGGEGGGGIVCCGTPEEVAGNPASHTGRYLQHALKREQAGAGRPPH